MTNKEQLAVDVAEKVWGWIDVHPSEDIVLQVFSWEGFGQTLEAMADKGQYVLPKHMIEWLDKEPKSLIEMTHRAALEYMKCNS